MVSFFKIFRKYVSGSCLYPVTNCFLVRRCVCFTQPPPIKPLDNKISLTDVKTIKMIGSGSGGIVQLVQHKVTNQFFALKVGIW